MLHNMIQTSSCEQDRQFIVIKHKFMHKHSLPYLDGYPTNTMIKNQVDAGNLNGITKQQA